MHTHPIREAGQAFMGIVIAVTVAIVAIPTILVLQAVNQAPLTHSGNVTKSAQAAADAGVADYEAHVRANPTYPSLYCSKTEFATCTTPADPHNPAFLAKPPTTPCATSKATTPGWTEVTSPTTGITSGYQYLVNSAKATASAGGTVYVYVTGRAGLSGRYTCASKAVSIAVYPPSETSAVSVAATSSWTSVPLPPPAVTHPKVTFSATMYGGSGGTGGTGTSDIISPGGAPGPGAALSITITGLSSTPADEDIFAGDPGKAGVSPVTGGGPGHNQGGTGYGKGGSGGYDGGGGGGASALCLESTTGPTHATACGPTTPVCTGATPNAPCVLAVAGGGGGGGETVCSGSGGGAGGAGGSMTGGSGGKGTTYTFFGFTSGDTTGPAGGGTQTGPGAKGTGYSIIFGLFSSQTGNRGTGHNGGAGVTQTTGGDSGGGGGGYWGGGSGGTGVACGGGGGGGGGSSYVDASFPGLVYQAYTAPFGTGQVFAHYTATSGDTLALTETCGSVEHFTVPKSGKLKLTVDGGAGGGGGAAGGATPAGGSGGDGSGVVVKTLAVTAGQTFTYEVGCGGGGVKRTGSTILPGSGGAGYASGGSGEKGHYKVTTPVGCGFLDLGSCTYNGTMSAAGGGGGATAVCTGTSSSCSATTLLVVAGGGGGGGMPACSGTAGSGTGGASAISAGSSFTASAGSHAGKGFDGSTGGNARDGAYGGGGASGSAGGGGGGNAGNGGSSGGGSPGGAGGQGATHNTDTYGALGVTLGSESGGPGGGGGFAGGGGGGASSCGLNGGGSGGGGGGSSWVDTTSAVALHATAGKVTVDAGSLGGRGAVNSCTVNTSEIDGLYTVCAGASAAAPGGTGSIQATLKITVTQRHAGSCSVTATAATLESTGGTTSWHVQVGGGGGASGTSGGVGGPGALVSVTVTGSSTEPIAVLTGCSGFYGSGGKGFADGGFSKPTGKTQGLGGGGGGASAICLEKAAGATTCSAAATPLCTSTTSAPCVLVVAAGGGGGGASATSCTVAGDVGGSAGSVFSGPATRTHVTLGDYAKGSPDSGGLAGGTKGKLTGTPVAANGSNGSLSGSAAGGGGGGWAAGSGGTTKTKCGGSGGSSWVATAAPGGVTLGTPTLATNTCTTTAGGTTSPSQCSGGVVYSTLKPGTVTNVAEKSIPVITSNAKLTTWSTS
ncbi:MAG: hypothetical protein M0Z95_14535 [Actinomycetota bacterium]|nr:hypothetical protein [Actinomycetota bacterium]